MKKDITGTITKKKEETIKNSLESCHFAKSWKSKVNWSLHRSNALLPFSGEAARNLLDVHALSVGVGYSERASWYLKIYLS